MKRAWILFTLLFSLSQSCLPFSFPWGESEDEVKYNETKIRSQRENATGGNYRIPLSMSMPVVHGGVGLGLHAGLEYRVSAQPLFLGVETGFDWFNSRSYYYNYYHYRQSTLGMPILFTLLYQFELPKLPTLSPYAGFAVGPYLVLSPDAHVVGEILLRPGIAWRVAHAILLQGETRFGILSGYFTVQPNIGVNFLF